MEENDCAIDDDSLQVMDQVMGQPQQALQAQQNNQAEGGEGHGLSRFQRNNPPTFKGRHDPKGVHAWLQEIEKIFRVMPYPDGQQIMYGTHILYEEAEYWWDNARQRFQASGTVVTWVVFRVAFLKKYFPADMRNKKEIEFLNLSQGNMSVADYAAKFEELVRFCPHYNAAGAEESKCIKFESGLRPEIKQFIGYQEIRQFPVLVNKCRIYNEDSRARSAYYKSASDKRNGNQHRSKPYVVPDGKGKQKFQQKNNNNNGMSQSGGGAPNPVKCFKCGVIGHRALECTAMTCYKYGKVGHKANECKSTGVVC